mmetsp:Transcript_49433/g.120659  ORF Transcript_49433/g.120659 Transcript_49433/m.120659 type:complete len:572 (-) Transcript_49433:479-2194(-)
MIQGLCGAPRAGWFTQGAGSADRARSGDGRGASSNRACCGFGDPDRDAGWGANVTVDFPCKSRHAVRIAEDRYEDGEVVIDKHGMRVVHRHSALQGGSPPVDDDALSAASTMFSDSLSVSEFSSPSDCHRLPADPCGGLLPKRAQAEHVEAVADWLRTSTPVRRTSAKRAQDSPSPIEDLSKLIQTGARANRPPGKHKALGSASFDAARPGRPKLGNFLEQFKLHNINTMLSKVRRVGRVGRGNSGTVWECYMQDGKQRVPLALKEVPLPEDESKRAMIVREMRMLKETDHPCLVECYGVYFSQNNFQMMMELVDGGSLLDLMKAAPCRIPHEAIGAVAHSVFSALAYLHDECAVVHRDVKPGNILLSLSGEVKLADLGICSLPGEAPSCEWLGTVTYMSPERMVGDEYAYAADVWSAGLVVLEAAMGAYPFMAAQKVGGQMEFWDLLDLIVSGPTPDTLLADAGVGAGPEMTDFVARCMDKLELERPTAAECLQLPFLQSRGKPARGQQRQQVLAEWVRGVRESRLSVAKAASDSAFRACAEEGDGQTSALQDFVASLGGGRFGGLLNML